MGSCSNHTKKMESYTWVWKGVGGIFLQDGDPGMAVKWALTVSMFSNLPDSLKQQILTYLEAADFKAAKELRDSYLLYSNDQLLQDEQEGLVEY